MGRISQTPKTTLVFNARKILIGIFTSVTAAAKAMQVNPQGVRSACVGIAITHHNYYFRYLPDDIELEMEDLGKLTLIEFDQICNEKRRVYASKKLKRNTVFTPNE